ncbi:hypothetical protein DL240_08595 [Lujinxingia litoralis]|uniref:ATP-binding protein n=1 Tax=Lujinxingia litoralis TaxID=2211119 RepID=A0A328C8E4_9DELT|nr:BREX system ATP-binding domain-containing protein [Lujinxingia litoralis]RAL22940.1 hypothetical protein DL240_08595 [Lujinxingia litoralis]
MISEVVEHPVHGEGRLVGLRRNGRLALVDFDSLPLPTLVPTRELHRLDQPRAESVASPPQAMKAPGAAPPPPEPSALARYALNPTDADRALEAMRLGVVPAQGIEAFTVAREQAFTSLNDALCEAPAQGALRVIEGDYGAGKTHLLEWAGQRALADNFLVARVTLDADETSPAHPQRVYRALISSLRYPDRPDELALGLTPLLERALLSDSARARFEVDQRGHGSHLYLSAALRWFDALNTSELQDAPQQPRTRRAVLDWLEGQRTRSNQDLNAGLRELPGSYPWLYSLKDYRPWARIYAYILSGIASLATCCGYAGLILLVDEAERFALLSRENREHAAATLRALSRAAIGERLGTHPADATLELGGAGRLRELPCRFEPAGGLGVLFALTPDYDDDALLNGLFPDEARIPLASPQPHHYAELARRVAAFYCEARGGSPLSSPRVEAIAQTIERLSNRGTLLTMRQVMKTLVELLDVHRHFPERADGVVDNLSRVSHFDIF